MLETARFIMYIITISVGFAGVLLYLVVDHYFARILAGVMFIGFVISPAAHLIIMSARNLGHKLPTDYSHTILIISAAFSMLAAVALTYDRVRKIKNGG